jgi:polar amino acid transport system substrate-binding protein
VRATLACVGIALVAGCNLPYDPDGTLDRVRGGMLRAGVSVREPWTRLGGGQPAGVEVTLLRELAGELGAKIDWTVGPESELMTALERRELDVVVGGLTDDIPWRDRVGLTGPYLTTDLVVGVPTAEPLIRDVRGREVGVREGRAATAAAVRTERGIPVWVSDPASHPGPVAADRWELHAWGFTPIEIRLRRDRHVMAVPPGENGWLVRLERFLYARQERLQEVLHAEATR